MDLTSSCQQNPLSAHINHTFLLSADSKDGVRNLSLITAEGVLFYRRAEQASAPCVAVTACRLS